MLTIASHDISQSVFVFTLVPFIIFFFFYIRQNLDFNAKLKSYTLRLSLRLTRQD